MQTLGLMTCTRRPAAMTFGILAVLVGSSCTELRLPDPDVVYIAFGDSATRGPSDLDYPDALAELLGEPADHMAKEGRGGGTLAEGVDRLGDLLADDIFPNAEVLLLWQGGADLIDFVGEIDPFVLWSVADPDYPYGEQLEAQLDDIRTSLENMIALGRSAGLQVYIATYFPILGGISSCGASPLNVLLPGQAERANEYVDLLNARIRQAAAGSAAVLVDVAAEAGGLAADPENYEDCNHLSAEGNRIVAEVFRDAIVQNRPQ